jgi:hypothetical protein
VLVSDYRCLALFDARSQIEGQGLSVGELTTNPAGQSFDDTWIVQGQLPFPGENVPPGTPVRLSLINPSLPCP